MAKGRALVRRALKNNYIISAPDFLTFFPHLGTQPDVLDILHHSSLPIESIETLNELNSDHNHVLIRNYENLSVKFSQNFSNRATW
jgi:hypothetical protein